METSLYEFDVCGKYFLIFFIEGLIFQFFYIGLQYGFWIRWKYGLYSIYLRTLISLLIQFIRLSSLRVPDAALSAPVESETAIDPDVQRERDYVLSAQPMEPSEVTPSELAINGNLAAVNAKTSSQLSVVRIFFVTYMRTVLNNNKYFYILRERITLK